MKEADRHEETMQAGETRAAPQLNSADYEEFLEIVEEMSRRDGYAPLRPRLSPAATASVPRAPTPARSGG
jgi:hypothetical protein